MVNVKMTDFEAYNLYLALLTEGPDGPDFPSALDTDSVVEGKLRWILSGNQDDFWDGVRRAHALVEKLREETGCEYDPEGPCVDECEHCGGVSQYCSQHTCSGKVSEGLAAAAFEDAAYGDPDDQILY